MEHKDIGFQARCLGNLIGRAIGRKQEEIGITPSQGFILHHLVRNGQENMLCLKDLEVKFNLTHPTVSGILSRMEAMGYVTLVPDPKDRRYKRIRLLPKGVETQHQVREAIQSVEDVITQGLSPEQQKQFSEYLTVAINNLNEKFPVSKEELHD